MTIAKEILMVDNAIQEIINTLESTECKIKCKATTIQFLRCAIGELDVEMESILENASS